MYANRYDGSRTSRPVSFGAALLVNGALIAGLWFARPELPPTIFSDPPLETENVPLPVTPPPEPEKRPTPVERVVTPATPPIHRPDPVVPLPPDGPVVAATRDPVIPRLDPPAGPGSAAEPSPPLPPVMVGAEVDPRFAGGFQPDYPGAELRQEIEGLVKVRVLIGVDGRIKAVERLASPTAGLFEATRRHALSKWRFKPATRDGIPVESWKVMTVRFRIMS